jgi:hypothetical protein
MPLIIPANTISGEYEVVNSLRFDDGSSDNLARTFSTSNRRTFTVSVWIKRSALGTAQWIFEAYNSTSDITDFYIDGNDNLNIRDYVGSVNLQVEPSAKLRDVSAWYHIVWSVDTTQATASDRVKVYINGIQQTSFITETYPSLNYETRVNSNISHYVGRYDNSTFFYDGYMSEFVFIDGQQLTPTSFGEFDEDSSVWKPIDVSGLTFGTNGFYLDFEDSGSLGADVSGNGNNFTVNNLTSIDQTTDTPVNNYATLNKNMAYPSTNITISDGNLDVIRTAGTSWQNILSTFAPSSGKWYAEVKVTGVGSNGVNIGFANIDVSNRQNLTNAFGEDANSAGIYSPSGAIFYNSGTTFATVGSYTAGDIIQLAMDIDNGYLYWGKNGTWLNSSDPESGATGTGGLALSNLTSGGSYAMGVSLRNSGDVTWNFGNPAFSISSGNSDANGYGNFEYAVPSGYYALNTKNLAEYG